MAHTIPSFFVIVIYISYTHTHMIRTTDCSCSGHPPEAEFLAKLKAIKGVTQVETQTITNVQI
jgi:hypothetical protein